MKNSSGSLSTAPRKRWFIWGCVVVIVVIGGLVVADLLGVNIPIPGLAHHDAASDFEEHDYEATVMVSDSGYSPAVLKVKPKTRVYFQNQTSSNHSVDVSAKVPDGSFGSIDQIVPNGGYAFTFIKKGDYNFHDGDNPLANGEVIVD